MTTPTTATVNISGTWSEKQKEYNGFDTHAKLIHDNRILRVPFVGFAEFHQWTEKATGNVLTVRITAIEPTMEADGSDPDGHAKATLALLDQMRKNRGKGSVDDIPTLGEVAGQIGFDFDGPGDDGDGERQVPEPSAEELMAERAETKAAKVPAAKFEAGAK